VGDDIARAVEILRRGGLVAFPTETVYGLGADAESEAAVRRIFAAKGRPADHPVIVHLGDAAALDAWADPVPPGARALAAAFWPGPLTLIVPRSRRALDVVTGGQASVGLRVPDHPVALALLRAFGGGLAAPSANRFGRVSPTRAAHVREEFTRSVNGSEGGGVPREAERSGECGEAVELVLEGGPSRVGVESTIVDLSRERPAILRPGAISPREVGRVLGVDVEVVEKSETRASGTLESHYAPRTPVRVVAPGGLEAELARLASEGRRARGIAAGDDAERYARELYATLRELDALGLDEIVVEAVPGGEAWLAVRDRLKRAAHDRPR
jgi:L-threonylcarbamoyladenylate synthase